MGKPLCAGAQTLSLGSAFQLWRLENVLDPGQEREGYDRFYVPRLGYVTGDLDIHDIAVGVNGEPVFVDTSSPASRVRAPRTVSFPSGSRLQ